MTTDGSGKATMTKTTLKTPEQIRAATAAFFGEPVIKLTAPGGRGRTSFRAYFAGRTVIVSQRTDPDQTTVETQVLRGLTGATDRVPQYLGSSDGLMFQSDVGQNRLNWAIHTLVPADRPALAADAIAAIFEIHRTARAKGLETGLPASGLRNFPDDNLAAAAQRMSVQLRLPVPGFDPARLHALFTSPPDRFVKWDCRAGNAAVDDTGRVRWFDFEDTRLAHGPEDFAWLLADETWPVPIPVMIDLIRDQLRPGDSDDPAGYMAYLEQYTTLQAIRRIRLIWSEAKRKGWSSKPAILKLDRVGTNPHMGERLSLMAGDLALRHAATAPLKPLFDSAVEVFQKVRIPAPQTPSTPEG